LGFKILKEEKNYYQIYNINSKKKNKMGNLFFFFFKILNKNLFASIKSKFSMIIKIINKNILI
jgi:hypothetical protein